MTYANCNPKRLQRQAMTAMHWALGLTTGQMAKPKSVTWPMLSVRFCVILGYRLKGWVNLRLR
jgi:hypothetical protein